MTLINANACYACCLMALSNLVFADNENSWLGENLQNNSIALHAGVDNDAGHVEGINASLTLPYYSIVQFGIYQSSTKLNRQTIDTNDYTLSWTTDPYAQWSWQISYDVFKDSHTLEAEDVTLNAQYFPGNWLLNVGYIDGNLDIFSSRANESNTRLTSNNITSTAIHRSGYSLEFEYYTGQWTFAINGLDLHYKRNLDPVQTNSRLQRYLGEQTLSQLFTLTDWKIDTNLHYLWNKTTIGAGIIRYKLAIGRQQENHFYTSLEQSVTNTLSAGFTLLKSTSSLTYGELSLYYSW